MDPVSIAFTILPLLAGAVKAYTSVRKRCRVIQHHSRELKRLQGKLDRQHTIFANESHLLVRIALSDDDSIEQMLEDPNDSQWRSTELETALRAFLANSYDAYLGIVDEVCTTIKGLEDGLSKYELPDAMSREGKSSRIAAPRLGNRIAMAYSTVGFEKTIEGLRELNSDLGRLRQQACELQNPNTKPPDRLKRARMCSWQGDFQTIRKASKGLHQALMVGWSSNAPSTTTMGNVRHDVKLFADAKVKDGVQLDLAIRCHGHPFPQRSLSTEPSWSILQVHSQNLKWTDTGWNTPPSSEDDVRPKRRRTQIKSASLSTPRHLNGVTPEPEDIDTNAVCLGFQKMCLKSSSTRSYHCLGSLDDTSENGFRHSFYQGQKICRPVHTICDQTVNMSYTMGDMIAEALDGCQSVLRQLMLARDLVLTVLKFYSTPWLGEYITAKDILFLGKLKASDLAQHLETLHLETSFVQNLAHYDSESIMEDPASSKAYEDAKIQYGVRNITLWCLGTMLLQIASWRQIDATDDVSTIRRLSGMTYCPGPRYQRLTKKCLECDFGCGDDLTQPRLQQAVHRGLICELNDMIQSLDIDARD
ncbi:hypothetical protein PG984_003047 [Apiospora sp. TS-2023a]